MNAPHISQPDLDFLIELFYQQPARLGVFSSVEASELPTRYRQLLAHNHHMTVTVESFHETAVDVEVLQVQKRDTHYSRCILLRRQTDQQVVQFGIVRLDTSVLSPIVRERIESENAPLGRVLIDNNVMRDVELCGLYRVECGEDLAKRLRVPRGTVTYGRTALIHCDEKPAIELLEIVAPIAPMLPLEETR